MHIDNRNREDRAPHLLGIKLGENPVHYLYAVDLITVDRGVDPHRDAWVFPMKHRDRHRDFRAREQAGHREFDVRAHPRFDRVVPNSERLASGHALLLSSARFALGLVKQDHWSRTSNSSGV